MPKEKKTVPTEKTEQPVLDPQHTPVGVNRGRYRFAAWLGLVIILLAIVGAVSIVMMGVGVILRASDQTPLMKELHNFAVPVSYYQPEAFETLADADSDTLLLAAIFKITKAEEVRQLRENTGEFSYKLDDEARLIVPTKEITAAYRELFGADAKPKFNTIGSEDQIYAQFAYDKENKCMHVPWIYSTSSSLYATVPDGITLQGNRARVKIGYVLKSSLGYDDLGERHDPDPKNAAYFQWFVFEKDKNERWHLTAVENEGDVSATTMTTAVTTTVATATTTTAATTESDAA